MSMLAEPRRKQRISVDPQNLQWRNDQNAVGKRMLERMGWRGGGLGRCQHGISENPKLRANHTQRGFGSGSSADGSVVDNNGAWVSHHEEFSQLLAQLNASKKTAGGENCIIGDNVPRPSSNSESRRQSLNVHRKYRPSMLLSHQKRAIFGSATNCAKSAVKISKISSEIMTKEGRSEEKEIIAKTDSDELADTKTTVQSTQQTSSLTMDTYFAQKMALRLTKRKIQNDHRG